MLSRRMFLVGASTASLMLNHTVRALAAPAAPVRDMNVQILADVVKDFLGHIDAFGGPDAHWPPLQGWYYEWSGAEGADLERKVVETVRKIYTEPAFVEIKAEYGSIFYEDGRMRASAQMIFAHDFPMNLQYAGTAKTFQAFAAFAPEHLL